MVPLTLIYHWSVLIQYLLAFESLHHLNRNFAVLYLIRLSIKVTLIGTMKNKLITTVTQPHPFFPFKGDLLYQSVFSLLKVTYYINLFFPKVTYYINLF
jgi:hypothetical protein